MHRRRSGLAIVATTLGLLLGLAAAGCLRTTSFQCELDADCGAQGRCEASGYCSVVDASCASGRRYGASAASYAGACVDGAADGGGDALGDAGADDAGDAGDAAVIECPEERLTACHPAGGSGLPCDPIQLTELQATFTLGLMMIDDTLHYASGDGDIHRLLYDGTARSTIVGDGGDSVFLAADEDTLYFTDYYDGQIRGVALGTQEEPFSVTVIPNPMWFGHIAVRAGVVYILGPDAVWMAPADGSQQVATRLTGRPNETGNPDRAIGIAVDDEHVYWSETDRIRRYPLAAAGDERAAEDFALSPEPAVIALDGDRVYWTGMAGLSWKNKDGSGATVVPVDDTRTRGLVLDGDFVFWSTPDGRIMRLPKGGVADDILVVAGGVPDAYELAVDCGAVYWGTFRYGQSGTVYKVRKP